VGRQHGAPHELKSNLMLTQKEQRFVQFERVAWEATAPGVRRKVMAYGDELMGVYVEFKRDAIGALHSHPHVQITYIQSGSFAVHIGSETRELGAGDFYYIPPHVVHGVEAREDSILIDVFTPMREEFVPAAAAANPAPQQAPGR
jgi:quercetin dioxygenase-like cupin family protein